MNMKLYVHTMTIRYTDYGDYLATATGIAWSTDGENTFGFEYGATVASVMAKMSEIECKTIEVLEGKPMARTHDMNPHGFI